MKRGIIKRGFRGSKPTRARESEFARVGWVGVGKEKERGYVVVDDLGIIGRVKVENGKLWGQPFPGEEWQEIEAVLDPKTAAERGMGAKSRRRQRITIR